MHILLVGSGAREHALAWKFKQSARVKKVSAWPGNGVSYAERLDLAVDAPWTELIAAVRRAQVDAVVVGPEVPLAGGIADALQAASIPVFGPEQRVAALESSKAFAKEVMSAASIPTARFHVARDRDTCERLATDELQRARGVVLKASGLAAGKGVFVCHSRADIDAGLAHLYDTAMRTAATEVVVEEMLIGRECSYFTWLGAGGSTPLGFAVDYKRALDGDLGPNTGGMGCYTPVPWLPLHAGGIVEEAVVQPLLTELKKRHLQYTGWLYVGLMWTSSGPRVVEFNVRLGDPETQVLVVQDDSDWGDVLAFKLGLAAKPATHVAAANSGFTVGVVMASPGYPFEPRASDQALVPASLLGSDGAAAQVFTAAVTPQKDGGFVPGKGRVLTVVGHGGDPATARSVAYAKVQAIQAHWPEAMVRRDIAANAATNLVGS